MTKPLYVLLVTPVFSPAAGFGGPVVFSKSLFDSLSRMDGVDVAVLTTKWGLSDARMEDQSEGNARAGKVRVCGFCLVRDFSLELLVRLPAAIRRADIVQVHSFFSATSLMAIVMARLLGKPMVLVPHGQLMDYGLSRNRWIKRVWRALATVVGRADRVVVRAASWDELIRNQETLPNFGHVQIGNGVTIPSRLARVPSEKRLLFLGRLDAVKQVEVLLEAMRILPPDVFLDIHGRGDAAYERSLSAKVEALGVSERVTFHGWLGEAGKSKAFASASAVVVPSKSESFGQVVIEALAHGLPVVASHGTPWAELDQRECGRWVQSGPEAIASACLEVLEMEPGAVRRRARRWVREMFTNDAIGEKFVAVYSELLDKPTGQAAKVRVMRRPAKVCIVSSCGGHLAEIRALAKAFEALPHIFVLNDRIAPPPDLIGRTTFIKHSERDVLFFVNLWEIFRILRRERPDILLSSGAGPIVPAAIIGRYLFGCRVVYVETMTRMRSPSLTGRIMYRLAHRFVYQWQGLKSHFPKGTFSGPLQ